MQMYDLVEDITKQLEEAGMKQLFEEIEVPLTRVLYAMEKRRCCYKFIYTGWDCERNK